ncbi:MAG: ComEC/Rec2 family competence protein [bacterium]
MNRPLLFITFALILGMAIAGFTSLNCIVAISLLIIVIILYAIFSKKYSQLIFIVFIFLGLALFSFQNTYISTNDIRVYMAHIDKNTKITGVKVYVKDDPECNDNKTYFTGKLLSVFENGREITGLRGKIRVTIEKNLGFIPKYGDVLYIKGQLRPPVEPKNLGEFDYKRYLKYKQVFYTVFAKDTACEKQSFEIDNYFKYYSYKIKEKLLEIIYSSIPKAEAEIMNGLMLGNQRVIPDDIYDKFKITGTVHILAVSGMNVGLIALFIFLLLKILKVKRKVAAVITLLFITVFAIITGAGASIVRATIMGYVVLLGLIMEKDTDLINSLSIAAFILLIFNPSNIYDVGFQLSFLATFGIIYFIDWVENLFKGLPKWLSGTLASTIAAQLFLSPVMADTFHQVSIISVLANIFIVPLAGMISILGFAMWLFGSISLQIGKVFGATIWLMIKGMMLIVDILAAIPYAAISVKTMPVVLSFLYYIFFLILPFEDINMKIKKVNLKISLAVVICVWMSLHILMPELKAKFYALSVRGINATIFVTAENKKILMLGSDDYKNNFGVKNTVVPFLRYKGINNIDELVLYSVENKKNLEALKRSFVIKSIYADNLSYETATAFEKTKLIDGEFNVKEDGRTSISFTPISTEITAGDKSLLFIKSLTSDIEKKSDCIIYSCQVDKRTILGLAKRNMCVINSGNGGFYRKPSVITGENLWDLSEKGMYQYP